MATYLELVALDQNDRLKQQVKAAISVSAFTITAEAPATPNHTARLTWAKAALANLDNEVERVIWYVLAANSAATVAQITAATDALVQTNVNAAVDLFAS